VSRVELIPAEPAQLRTVASLSPWYSYSAAQSLGVKRYTLGSGWALACQLATIGRRMTPDLSGNSSLSLAAQTGDLG